jgi:hypothetical protein
LLPPPPIPPTDTSKGDVEVAGKTENHTRRSEMMPDVREFTVILVV